MCLNSGVIIRGLIIKVKQCERGLKPATTCFAETLSQHVVAGFSPRLYQFSGFGQRRLRA